jgi:hypothetical protein
MLQSEFIWGKYQCCCVGECLQEQIKPDKDNSIIGATEKERITLLDMNSRILTCVEYITAWGNKHNYWSHLYGRKSKFY